MTTEKIFADGAFFKRPREGAPAFVKGQLSFKVDSFIAFLNKHVNSSGYVNLTLKESKKKTLYFELDLWTKTLDEAKKSAVKAGDDTKATIDYPEDEVTADSIPF